MGYTPKFHNADTSKLTEESHNKAKYNGPEDEPPIPHMMVRDQGETQIQEDDTVVTTTREIHEQHNVDVTNRAIYEELFIWTSGKVAEWNVSKQFYMPMLYMQFRVPSLAVPPFMQYCVVVDLGIAWANCINHRMRQKYVSVMDKLVDSTWPNDVIQWYTCCFTLVRDHAIT